MFREIGQKLDVKTVLEGSLRRAGNRLRITAQLINVADGYHLWSERYDREMEDIFDIQDDITLKIVDALRIRLVGDEEALVTKRHTENVDAHNLYLRGLHHIYKFTVDGVRKSIGYFEQSLALDENYALAHAGLSFNYAGLGVLGWKPPREVMPKAKAETERALDLDDTIAEAHHSMGIVLHYYEWDWKGAEEEYRNAIRLSPSDALLHTMYASLLLHVGRFDDAMSEANVALRLDPVSLEAHRMLTHTFYFARQYDAVMEQCRRTIDLDNNYMPIYWYVGAANIGKGDYGSALSAFERGLSLDQDNPINQAYVASTPPLIGRRNEALEILTEFKQRREREYFPAYLIALVFFYLDETDQTFDWLNKAYDEKDGMLADIGAHPFWDPIRDDARFQDLLGRMNFPKKVEP